jgi:hypothetical protein
MRGVVLWSEANNVYFYITQAWIHMRGTCPFIGILGRCYSTTTVTDIMLACLLQLKQNLNLLLLSAVYNLMAKQSTSDPTSQNKTKLMHYLTHAI